MTTKLTEFLEEKSWLDGKGDWQLSTRYSGLPNLKYIPGIVEITIVTDNGTVWKYTAKDMQEGT